MKKVALLIPVFNGLKYTSKCITELKSIIDSNPPDQLSIDIIVIDDGSTDGTSAWIEENAHWVKLLHGNGNLWWSGSVNVGAKYALSTLGSDYILLWNNDIIVSEDYFQQLNDILKSNDNGTIIGSKIFHWEQKDIIWSYGGYFNPKTGKKYMIGWNKKDGPEFNTVKSVDWHTGMGTTIPGNIIETIGYWDEVNFPQYHGDIDFTYKAKINGFEIKVYPKLQLWNDTTNTGIKQKETFKELFKMFTEIRSQFNFKKNMLFYRKYVNSNWAYLPIFSGYSKLLGGFIKWKLLGLFGIKRSKI